MINKEEFLKYIDESLADLKDEQWYNEYLYKAGDNQREQVQTRVNKRKKTLNDDP